MKIVADIHLHSHFSRATSKTLNLEHLSKWAQLKGVQVVGTGDIAHPGWLQEMRARLEPAEDGLFRLKEEIAKPIQSEIPKSCHGVVRFMLAGEISNIYKKNDKVRKIHNVVFMPSFEAVEKFQARLETIGNIRSDGRPILGLDSRDLLEIVLETDPQGYLIPAHIWTPWFALFGSMSGFDAIEECFGDLTDHIFALETGLSSDPPMNWRLSSLDNYTLVSNSDAHSPPKLAREANIFDTTISYSSLFAALKTGDPEKFLGTIEFFPEEGKYHYDG
ncbi:MAG: endonuclease Q family protein, partial [bacterium]